MIFAVAYFLVMLIPKLNRYGLAKQTFGDVWIDF